MGTQCSFVDVATALTIVTPPTATFGQRLGLWACAKSSLTDYDAGVYQRRCACSAAAAAAADDDDDDDAAQKEVPHQ